MEAESALPTVWCGLFQHTLLRSGEAGRGKNPDFAVGEDAINVEKNEFDFAGASSGGWFRHRRNSSRLGIAGSPVDFLICAAAHRRGWAILTTDRDFRNYASVLPVKLHSATTSREF